MYLSWSGCLPNALHWKGLFPAFFRTGQPLGYYASWPLFTLSHYSFFCIGGVLSKCTQVSASLGMPSLAMTSVLQTPRWQKVYRDALDTLKVQVSLPVSEIGCAEFAKKFRVRGLVKDLQHGTMLLLMPICQHPENPPSHANESPSYRTTSARAPYTEGYFLLSNSPEETKSFTSYLWLLPTIGSLTDTWLEPLAISKLATGKEGIDSRSPCALQPESDSLSKHLRWAKRKES